MNTGYTNTRCYSGRNPIRKWLIGRKLRKLKLEGDQAEQLDALIANARSVARACGSEGREAQGAIVALITEEGFDRDRAVDLVRTAADRQFERALELVTAFDAFYRGLKPTQQAQLQVLLRRPVHRRSRCCH